MLPIFLLIATLLTTQCGLNQSCIAPLQSKQVLQAKTHEDVLKIALQQWQNGLVEQAIESFKLAANLGSSTARFYLPYVSRLNNQPEQNSSLAHWANAQCKQQLVFIAADLSALSQANLMMQQFKQDKRLRTLPICIAPQIVFVPELLQCEDHDAATRITCDIAPLGATLKNVQFTQLVVFTQSGKANVHNGIMYLDQQDTYDVFVHELAHFAGFVDEYPLSAGLAERICAGVDAPNIVFQQAGQTQPNVDYWRRLKLLSKVAQTPVRTCDNTSAQAFKASPEMTFMEYHDFRNIPPVYLQAWQYVLNQPSQLTPAYINFAQLYEAQKSQKAAYWRSRYNTFHQQP